MKESMLKHYKTLEIPYGSPKEEVKKAFRRLASIYHPDRPTGDLKKMQELTEAYSKIMRVSAPTAIPSRHTAYTQRGDFNASVEDIMRKMDAFNEKLRQQQDAYQRRAERARNFESLMRNRNVKL